MAAEQTAPVFDDLADAELRETRRLDAIRRWRVLEAPPDAFAPMTRLAATIYEVPYGAICVVDRDRVWFKDPYGLTLESVPRRPGLCCSAVAAGAPLFVPDARDHPESSRHPLVAGEFGIRFYAGVPLRTSDGFYVGTLSVFDQRRREITDAERGMLLDLAGMVVREIEVRLAARVEVSTEKEEADAERAKAAHLESALGTHGLIGQAMGILMAQRRYGSTDAFAALRHVSQRRNIKLIEVARNLVEDVDRRNRGEPG
jgi:GAF domain-containing protein